MTTTTILVLSETEDARLARNETRISQGLASFVEVGEALSDIRDARLYRATHGTFEEYCLNRWNMKRAHAYRLIESAEVVSPIGDKSKITSESQARELARVEPARREEVIRAADIATGGKITAAAIKQAAAPAKEIVVTVEPTMTVLHPLPPHVISAESLAAGDAADAESEKLWLLKSTWRKTNKKDRAAFIEWAEAPVEKIEVKVEQPTPKSGRYVMPPRGMFLARGAMAELEKIQPKDSELNEAMDAVIDWCRAQLDKQAAAPVQKIVVKVEESAPRRRRPSPTFSMEDWASHSRNMIRNMLSFVPDEQMTEAREALHALSENTLPR